MADLGSVLPTLTIKTNKRSSHLSSSICRSSKTPCTGRANCSTLQQSISLCNLKLRGKRNSLLSSPDTRISNYTLACAHYFVAFLPNLGHNSHELKAISLQWKNKIYKLREQVGLASLKLLPPASSISRMETKHRSNARSVSLTSLQCQYLSASISFWCFLPVVKLWQPDRYGFLLLMHFYSTLPEWSAYKWINC